MESGSGMRLCTWFAGIDLDSRYLTATLGFSNDGESPRILGSKVVQVTPDILYAPSANPELKRHLSEIGRWFHLESGGTLQRVAVAVPGNDILEMPSSGDCQFGVPTPIDGAAIDLAIGQALTRQSRIGPVVQSSVRNYALDGTPASSISSGTVASSLRVELITWVAKRDHIQGLLDEVRAMGFDVDLIAPRAVAATASALTAVERREGAILVMIGDEFAECATVIDSSVVDVFTVPLGRNPLRREIARACDISPNVVDRLDLRMMLDRVPTDPIVQRVRTVLAAWGTALFTSVRRRLDDRSLLWHLEAGIVIANASNAFPALDERAAQIVGTPARFADMTLLQERISGVSRGSFAAMGLIPMQLRSEYVAVESTETHRLESEIRPVVIAGQINRGGLGQAIGRWLREFVPADHH
jgi:cell division ATPase FtsA